MKRCVHAKLQLCPTLCDIMDFPPLGDLPNTRTEPVSLMFPV